jgi:hypothetical protein
VSFTPHQPPGLQEARAEETRRDVEKLVVQKAMVDRDAEGVSEVPGKRGIAQRLRGVFGRRDASPPPPERDVSGEDVWERERQHRREHEADQSGGGESTLPDTRYRM